MGKLLKKTKAKKVKINKPAQYIVALNQEEADMLSGIIADLLDNPQRKVAMTYEVDETKVVPTKRGMKALKGAHKAFNAIEMADDYWYDDLWETPVDKSDVVLLD